ncbi:MAG: HPt (histidine-containing phosphotransfer) domain-containing protein [Sulfurimonas sp.]|jgi:HPt (histidine-containing phosphotransfer) domain-containing protein|uniref:Hpt domain-containing protein n=1 Tax=Sulfurimonas sp. TaxID=2022749 RepID=UPI0039E5D0D9
MPIVNVNYSDLNFDEMAAAIGLKSKHMPMLVGSFLEESELILTNIETAISKNNYADLKLHAHSMKGSAGNLKFTEIYDMTKEMELAAAEADASFDYSSYLDAVKNAVATIPN